MPKKLFKSKLTNGDTISQKDIFVLASKVITDNPRLTITPSEDLLNKFNKAYDTLKEAAEQQRY